MRLTHLVVSILLLAGCARETPPDAELTAGGLTAAAAPPAAFAAGATAGVVTDGWLETFNDPVLVRLVDEALVGNSDLAAAAARVEQAASEARQAGADLKPQVGFAMQGTTGQAGGAKTEKMGAGLNLSWEIDVWGRMSSAQSAATNIYASRQADLMFAQQSLAAQVVKSWFLAVQAVQQEAIATQAAALQAKNVELVALREKAGRASALDSAQARAAASTSAEQVHQAMSGRERAARSLEILLGRYPAADLTIATTLPALPPSPPAGMPSQILERRPDLIAATRRVASAFNQKESAKAARLPRLSITANAGAVAQNFKDLSLDDVFWNVAGNLVGPIFDGGRLKEQVIIEEARQAEALALYGKAALEAFRQVEQGLSEERRLVSRLDLLHAAATDQTEAERLAQARFDAGAIDQLSLILVQERALQARLASVAVRVEGLTNRVDLHLALGGSFRAPEPTAEDALPASKIVKP